MYSAIALYDYNEMELFKQAKNLNLSQLIQGRAVITSVYDNKTTS